MPKSFRLLIFAALAALAIPASASADVPKGGKWTEAYIQTSGQPTLHADVFRPQKLGDDVKTPVILAIGPYFGHGGQSTPDTNPGVNRPSNRFDDMIEGAKVFDRGYSVVYVDLRGFGGSTGCNDFGGPGEQLDTKRAVEWAASQPWSTGKVGMWGKSYDAWTQVMALDEKPKGLAAAIIQSPIIDGYRTLYQDGVHYDSGWYGTPALYQAIDAIPPAPSDGPDYVLAYAQGTQPHCYAANIGQQTAIMDWSNPFWQARNLPNARGSDVPVFWSHGFMDANTKPDNFLSVWETLKGPKRAWFGQWDHVRGNEDNLVGRKGFLDETMRWLDRYVKGDTSVNVDQDPPVTVQEGDGKFRPENAWPPADARVYTMPLKPGSVTDAPNNDAEGETSGEYGVGIYSTTKPFPNEARLAGPSTAKLEVTGGAPRSSIYTLLYDVDPKGVGQLITRGAYAVTGAGTIEVKLYPQDWTVKAGNRLLLLTAGADLDWYNPPHSGQTITVKSGTLSMPFLQYKRTAFLAGKQAVAMGGRKKLQFELPKLDQGAVDMSFPPAQVPFPAGAEPKGGQQIPLDVANRLLGPVASVRAKPAGMRISVRRVKLRGLRARRVGGRRGFTVIVSGVTVKKLRLELRRGKRVIGRKTVTARNGFARHTFRQRGKGRFRVYARSTAKSRKILARSSIFRGW